MSSCKISHTMKLALPNSEERKLFHACIQEAELTLQTREFVDCVDGQLYQDPQASSPYKQENLQIVWMDNSIRIPKLALVIDDNIKISSFNKIS